MANAKNNNMILYGGIGLAVVVVLIIASLMMKKEGFNTFNPSAIVSQVTDTYTPGPGAMGIAPYVQGGSLMLESDVNGNLSTSASLPIGAIIIWFGPLNSIPVGWALCDGNNGTPNLIVGNFPQGVSNDQTLGTTVNGQINLAVDNVPLITTACGSACAYNIDPKSGAVVTGVGSPVTSTVPQTVGSVNNNYLSGTSNNKYVGVSHYKSSDGTLANGNPAPFTAIPPCIGVYYIMKMQ